MAYSKQVWSSNELITEAKLNHMEEGIANADTRATEQIADIINNQSRLIESVEAIISKINFSVNATNKTLTIGLTNN